MKRKKPKYQAVQRIQEQIVESVPEIQETEVTVVSIVTEHFLNPCLSPKCGVRFLGDPKDLGSERVRVHKLELERTINQREDIVKVGRNS